MNEASENRLARRLDRALSVLRQVEWCQWEQVAVDDVVNLCPLCDQTERRGHAPDCPLGALLQEGGA